jgi:hypothetical protein
MSQRQSMAALGILSISTLVALLTVGSMFAQLMVLGFGSAVGLDVWRARSEL